MSENISVKQAIDEISKEIEEDKALEKELLGPRDHTPIIPITLNFKLADPRPFSKKQFSYSKSIGVIFGPFQRPNINKFQNNPNDNSLELKLPKFKNLNESFLLKLSLSKDMQKDEQDDKMDCTGPQSFSKLPGNNFIINF